MQVTVMYFKPSGKWYTTEEITLPDESWSWDIRVRQALRIKGMHAVIMEPNPWGFPTMITCEQNNNEPVDT